MVKIGKWRKRETYPNYMVWALPQKPMHNPHSVVVKTEMGDWVTFVSMGDAGTTLLNRYGSKRKNLLIAQKYMKEHSN